MRDEMQTRLDELKREFDAGQAKLQEIEKQQAYLRETLLRISGAIQVLEELLAARQTDAPEPASPPDGVPTSP